MPHWLDGVARVLMSPELDLRKLAEIGGADATYLYQFSDLSRCDLRGQKLGGLDFTGAVLEGAALDRITEIDSKFDPRLHEAQYYRFRVNRNLLRLLNAEALSTGYTYAVWSVKWLFDLIYQYRDYDRYKEIRDSVKELHLDHLFICEIRSEYAIRRIKIPYTVQTHLNKPPSDLTKHSFPSFLLLCALIIRNGKGRGGEAVLSAVETLKVKEEKLNNRRTSEYISLF
jgi:hypothetical protein